eukprot:TRINITY_DN56_c0_g1_i1.p2 TRINITY_DN56_c0_g1~~TRINITY_DN56_c0_g1_i1.p2  ORF type:complete len:120 (+),score=26.75 TRINITY_DN56_c0_g1_i1:94-453(+)
MASLGQTVASRTRPLRAKVKASVACPVEHPAFHKKPETAPMITAAKAAAAPAAAADPHVWGVKWAGVPLNLNKEVTLSTGLPEVKKSFQTWHIFSLGGPGLYSSMAGVAMAAFSSKIGK